MEQNVAKEVIQIIQSFPRYPAKEIYYLLLDMGVYIDEKTIEEIKKMGVI